MRERTALCDRYLLDHFYQTCHPENQRSIHCRGVKLMRRGFSWMDVILDGGKTCGNCHFVADRQGFFEGKGKYSAGFEQQQYVSIYCGFQEEFESVCTYILPEVRGMVISGGISDASPLKKFHQLEFICFSSHRLSHFWDTSANPNLRILTIYGNDHLKSLDGLEYAKNLECVQFLTDTSRVSVVKIASLEPLSKLANLKEVILSGVEPVDHAIDYLIDLPQLEYLWVSPNVFPVECYAKFEAKKFMLYGEYGIYSEDFAGIYPLGKGKRVMSTAARKAAFLREYYALMDQFR